MRNLKINKEHYHPGTIPRTDPLFRNIFDESPDAIFLLDPEDFVITDCNHQALQLFQAEVRKSLEGKPAFALYDSEPVDFSRSILVESVNNGSKQIQEVAFRTVKGNIFWGCGSFQKITTSHGNLIVFRVKRVVDYMMTAEMLARLVKHTSKVTGNEFFTTVTELLGKLFGVGMAFIAKINKVTKMAETLCYWPEIKENNTKCFDLLDGPSQNVVKGYTTFYPSHLRELFPNDNLVHELEVESYVGTPIYDASGEVSGLLVLMDRKPMDEVPNLRFVLSLFAARAGAELERLEMEKEMRRQIEYLESGKFAEN